MSENTMFAEDYKPNPVDETYFIDMLDDSCHVASKRDWFLDHQFYIASQGESGITMKRRMNYKEEWVEVTAIIGTAGMCTAYVSNLGGGIVAELQRHCRTEDFNELFVDMSEPFKSENPEDVVRKAIINGITMIDMCHTEYEKRRTSVVDEKDRMTNGKVRLDSEDIQKQTMRLFEMDYSKGYFSF